MGGLVQFLRSFGAGRIAAMIAVTLALIGFFAFVMVRFTAVEMTPLFTDLSLSDSAAIVKELDQQAIPYELRQDGAGILVPRDKAAKIRMQMAEKRLPSGGGVGWEIFDKGDGFSSTSFVQNVNHLRALEGELSRSIASLDRVASARVHLVVPERPLFSRDAPQPSASIVIRTRGELGAGEVRAIRHLVASAVQGLKPEKVSLVDDSGKLLADGADLDPAAQGDDQTTTLEKRLRDRVEAIVGRVVGSDRARVEVRADIDRTKSTLTSENYDPESKVVRSTQTREESSQSTEPAEQGATVANQLPNANAAPAGAQGAKDASNKNEEVVNYEISRTTRTEVLDGGKLKRISVAVLVDGVYSHAPNGDVSYAARPQEELDRIAALVRAGVGFDQARGDTVEVVNLRFADAPSALTPAAEPGFFEFDRSDIMRFAELGVLALLSLLVLLFVVRPLLRKALSPEAPPLLATAAQSELVPAQQPGVAGAPGQQVAAPSLVPEPTPLSDPAQTGRRLEAAEMAGRLKAESIDKVGEMIMNNPTESVSIIRQWMQEPA
ncbi:flagellar basal-body MS-ring/collar protein FliF [Hansschlegelia quercus]|uniref:Flagellar M-ring protein n=1 Tax=Hansschlegelia quercus TaxID=2528245 RepID=A0A4Q9GHC9_9HYPH|nr:flagellar basal-body MS-ring/collar protein FliF [Hansschlegelia quercus]TBN53388.1 flagellar M-ring protein FliF [Hansschlegelia quercus]